MFHVFESDTSTDGIVLGDIGHIIPLSLERGFLYNDFRSAPAFRNPPLQLSFIHPTSIMQCDRKLKYRLDTIYRKGRVLIKGHGIKFAVFSEVKEPSDEKKVYTYSDPDYATWLPLGKRLVWQILRRIFVP